MSADKRSPLSDAALEFALEWCLEGYEGDPAEDTNVALAHEFATWAAEELERRMIEREAGRLVRRLAKEGRKVTPGQAKRALRDQLAKQAQA